MIKKKKKKNTHVIRYVHLAVWHMGSANVGVDLGVEFAEWGLI